MGLIVNCTIMVFGYRNRMNFKLLQTNRKKDRLFLADVAVHKA